MSRRAWMLGALCWALLGCTLRPPRVGEPGPSLPDSDDERAYQQVLERHTSHREVYALFDTRMLAAATYQAPAFREARVRRLGKFQAQSAEQVQRNLAVEAEEAGQHHDFFFGVHVNDSRYDDFDKRDSIWRIALVTEAGEILPGRVERIGRSNLNLRALYPYLDDFWVAYRIRFPRLLPDGQPVVPEGARSMVLRVASTLGQADFTFTP